MMIQPKDEDKYSGFLTLLGLGYTAVAHVTYEADGQHVFMCVLRYTYYSMAQKSPYLASGKG